MTTDLLQAFIDDLLPEPERRALTERLERDPELATELDLQRRIAASIHRAFTPPDALPFPVTRPVADAPAPPNPRPRSRFRSRPTSLLALAAALLMTIVGVWLASAPWRIPPLSGQYAPVAWRSAFDDYTGRNASGFEPQWTCEGAVFERVFRDRHGVALQYDAANAFGAVATGLVYTNVISPRTTGILVKHDGRGILILVDRQERESAAPPEADPDSGLYLHRRLLGDLVLYEVSPFAEARALAAFIIPEGTSP